MTLVHTHQRSAALHAVRLVIANEFLVDKHNQTTAVVATEFVDHAVRLISGAESKRERGAAR